METDAAGISGFQLCLACNGLQASGSGSLHVEQDTYAYSSAQPSESSVGTSHFQNKAKPKNKPEPRASA